MTPRAVPIDHRIHLMFGLALDDLDAGVRLAALKIEDVAASGLVHPSRLAYDAPRPIADRAIWESAESDVSPDLYPFVHAILDSRLNGLEKPSRLRLSPSGLNLANGRYRRPSIATNAPSEMKAGFSVRLAGASKSRLGLPETNVDEPQDAFWIVVESIDVHLFRTKFGVVNLSCRVFADVGHVFASETLVELLPRLCDARGTGHLSWRDVMTDLALRQFPPSVLVSDLVGAARCRLVPRDRIYSFSVIVFDAALPNAAARDLAFRLSRHYNARYRPTDDFAGTVLIHPFETVLHAMSREGTSTVITRTTDEGVDVEFLTAWISQSHARVYVPLQIAAFHEHVVLLDLAQGSGLRIDLNGSSKAETLRLRALCERFLLFRLQYRLSQVSSLTMHDLAYAATEQALGLKTLSEKISRDMLAVERRLVEIADVRATAFETQREARGRRLESNFAVIAGIGSAALTYLTLTTVAEHIIKSLPPLVLAKFLPVNIAIQLIAVSLAIVAGVYNWQRQRLNHDEFEHYVEHAEEHLVIENARDADAASERSPGEGFRDVGEAVRD